MTNLPGSRRGRMRPLDLEPVAPPPVLGAEASSWYFDRRKEIAVSVNAHGPGGWHLSISGQTRYPTWDEIVEARYKCVPDHVMMAMLLPSKDLWVDTHEFCFHLHEVRRNPDGTIR